jgi:hypothetical protein
MARHGQPFDTFLLSHDAAANVVADSDQPDLLPMLLAGWPVSVFLDRFYALTLYGYDCNTL